MNILVINCGSSSLKYQLIDIDNEKVLVNGQCDRVGTEGSSISYELFGKDKIITSIDMPNHTVAIKIVIKKLLDKEVGVIRSLDEIHAVGHRIVHGGEKFSKSVLLSDSVLLDIEDCNDLAPFHNPANMVGINSCKEIMPNIPMVGVFDTAFHQTMPTKAYLYGLPYEYYEKHKVRRNGFHGTSHDYVSKRGAQILDKNREDLKIIVCYLGNGASISAVMNGKSVDTSMGVTPLEGLIMGTRSGDIDPTIISFIAEKERISQSVVLDILNKKSGVLGLSKLSSDFRDLSEARRRGNELARKALEAYTYRVAKYIGAYTAAMNGVDVLIFTACVGENDSKIREDICQYIGFLGASIDLEKNNVNSKEAIISKDDSKVTIMVVPTNEGLAIARETAKLIK